MFNAFSPEQVIALGKALDQLVEKYGPCDDEQKAVFAKTLIRLASEKGIWEVDKLVEMARPKD